MAFWTITLSGIMITGMLLVGGQFDYVVSQVVQVLPF